MVSNNMCESNEPFEGGDDGPSPPSSSPVRALRPDVVHPVLSQWSSAGCSRGVEMFGRRLWSLVTRYGGSRPTHVASQNQTESDREGKPPRRFKEIKKSAMEEWETPPSRTRTPVIVTNMLVNFETHYL